MSDWISGLTSPRRTATSSGIGEVLHSPSMGCRSEASTILSLLRANREAMHCCSSLAASQRTSVGQLDSLAQACSALAKARVLCSLIIQKSEETGEGMYCSSWSPGIAGGGATTLQFHVEPEVTRRPQPATKPGTGPHTHWKFHLGYMQTSSSSHRVSAFYTITFGGSLASLYGSTCRGGTPDLVPLALTRIGWWMTRLWAWHLM